MEVFLDGSETLIRLVNSFLILLLRHDVVGQCCASSSVEWDLKGFLLFWTCRDGLRWFHQVRIHSVNLLLLIIDWFFQMLHGCTLFCEVILRLVWITIEGICVCFMSLNLFDSYFVFRGLYSLSVRKDWGSSGS